jgi:hypothetical protein
MVKELRHHHHRTLVNILGIARVDIGLPAVAN